MKEIFLSVPVEEVKNFATSSLGSFLLKFFDLLEMIVAKKATVNELMTKSFNMLYDLGVPNEVGLFLSYLFSSNFDQ